MNHASLFSGIGGFDLAAQWVGWANVFQVEIDGYCQQVLARHFPDTERYGDIKQFDGSKYRGAIDVLSGGFPCQPFSLIGKRRGTSDKRYLWPDMLRVIREVQPRYVVAENVLGIISLELEQVCSGLEREGYEVWPFIIPACSVGASHIRRRVWIVAYSGSKRRTALLPSEVDGTWGRPSGSDCGEAMQVWERPTPAFTYGCRMVDGLPGRMDRIKALGNAIVPQVAYHLFKIIDQTKNPA